MRSRRLHVVPITLALVAGAGMARIATADACGTIVGNAGDGLTTQILTNTTWGDALHPSPICLEEPIYVGNPGIGDVAVLTIVRGTIVRGQPRRGPPGTSIDHPGAILVTRGSRIVAEGTATAPIIMTTAAVDNDGDGACDNLDRGQGNTFRDAFPGLHPNLPPGCAATETCATACRGPACTPLFCDDTPANAPLAPLDAAGEENVALWGGLAVLGQAPLNLGDDEGAGYGVAKLNPIYVPSVIDLTYGGVEPHDNSGAIRYVSLRHAGESVTAFNELDGIALMGVGDATLYEHVEIYASWDDGHEIQGGTLNGNHLVALFVSDDSFDIDKGYTGTLQYLLGVMPFFNEQSGAPYGAASGDRLGEWDNVDAGNANLRRDDDGTTENTPWPFGNPYVWNLTGIGSTPDVNPAVSPAAANRGLFLTAAFAGQVFNSIIVNTGPNSCFECDAGGGILGMTCPSNAGIGRVRLAASICADTVAPNAAAAAQGDNYAELLTGDPVSYDNLSTVSDVLMAENAAGFTGRGGADGKLPAGGIAPYDPRPTGAELGVPPQGPGLDRAATYRGAFEPGAAELWTTGWTAGNAAGLIAD